MISHPSFPKAPGGAGAGGAGQSWAASPCGLQDEATSEMMLPRAWTGTRAAGNGRSADGFWLLLPKPCLEAKTRQGSVGAWRDMVVARCSQSHPLSGCPQFPVVPPASPGAAWRHSPSLRRSDPGHSRFSPTSLGAATHTALPHIGAPVGAAARHPHPRELLQPPPKSQKLGLCLQSAIPGLSHVRYKLWLLTADYVFKSALVEQQAAAGRRGTST